MSEHYEPTNEAPIPQTQNLVDGELDIDELVRNSTAVPGQVNIPIGDENRELTESELEARKKNNVFTPTREEVNTNETPQLNRAESLKHAETVLGDMAKDMVESRDMRKTFASEGLNPALNAGIKKTASEMTEEERAKHEEELKSKESVPKTEEERREELSAKHSESIAIIEKIGDGWLKFSDEEREIIEKSNVIRLKNVENIDLSTIRTQKKKSMSVDRVMSLSRPTNSFQMPLAASGFMVSVRGLSTQELQNLWDDNNEMTPVQQQAAKWGILHSCILDTTIGKLSYAEFMSNVSSTDYETLIFAVLCATYPEDDSIDLTCVNENCKQNFEHKYTLRSLIRSEKFNEEMREELATIIDASTDRRLAAEIHETSPVKKTESFLLPKSKYIVTTYTQSAEEVVNISYAQLMEVSGIYEQSAILTTAVKQILVPSPEEEGVYIEYDDPRDIIKIIFGLKDVDSLILSGKIQEILSDKTIEYGFMNVTCPHCQQYDETLTIQLQQLLFQHSQRTAATTVE